MKKVSIDDGEDIYNFLAALGENENGFSHIPPKSSKEFRGLIKKYLDEEKIIRSDRVPQFVYWMYDRDEVVGMIKIRKQLTPALLKNGGNMGYTISPKHRGNGYGNRIVKEGIRILSEENLNEILITVYDDNIPSRKAAESNGGKLRETSENICKYWITI